MNSMFILGIGGSGTKSLEAFIHLMVAGIIQSEIDISFLDQDISNGNLVHTTRLVDIYKKLRLGLRGGLSKLKPESYLFRSPLNKESNSDGSASVWQPVDPPFEKMSGLFQRNLLRQEARHMLDCLFDPVNEVDLELVHGFRGRPAIGQAVLAAGLHNKLPFWEFMKSKLNAGHQRAIPQKFFLIGSVFGGTGAAGVPTVARWLSRELKSPDGQKEGIVGAALLLPYFKYPDDDPDGDVAKGRLLGSSSMLARTRLALEYYKMHMAGIESGTARLGKFDSLYMVGWPEMIDLRYQASGGQSQNNPALMPELLAALATAHFSLSRPESNHGGGKLFRAGYAGDNIEWDDLPNPAPGYSTLTIMRPLACLVRFAFAYKYIYYETIFGENAKSIYSKQVWYSNLFGQPGSGKPFTFTGKSGELEPDSSVAELGKTLYDYCDYLLRWAASLSLHGSKPGCELFNVETAGFAKLETEFSDNGRPIGLRVRLYEEQPAKIGLMKGIDRYKYLPFEHINNDIDNIFENLINWNSESKFASLQEVYRFLCISRPKDETNTGFPAFIHSLWYACAQQKGDFHNG